MTYIYLTDGKGVVRTNDEEVAQVLEHVGFHRCDAKEYAAVLRRLRRMRAMSRQKGESSS